MQELEAPQDVLARIKALVDRGAGMDEILTAVMPEARLGHLRQLAWLRRFNHRAMEVATGLNAEEVKDELASLGEGQQVVESIMEPGTFTVASNHRKAARDWWGIVTNPETAELLEGDPEKLAGFRSLHGRMVAHFEKAGEQWLPELLHHLCVVDPARAVELLDRKLGECFPQRERNGMGAIPATHPEAHDGIALSAAIDLLSIVDAQKEFLPRQERDIYFDLNGRRETWTAAAREWFRSRRYISRARIEAWFAEQRQEGGRPLLFLHAPGGSGKTMALRWLTTHHCLPRGEPVAHLDFDDYTGGGSVAPWQLLLRCAEQLNRQLPRRPLTPLLNRMAAVEASLQELRNKGETEASLPPVALRTIEEFLQEFERQLRGITNNTVTIIVDTLEEPMVRPVVRPGEASPVCGLVEFIALLVKIAKGAPNVRVILCGRYALSHLRFEESLKAVQEIWQFYDNNVRRERLPRFDREETGTYLRARNLHLSEDQLDTLFANASTYCVDERDNERECSPFILSLFIATVEAAPDEVPKLITHPEQLKVVYLMERVISHLEDVALRWVIRYGVVPRTLSRRFFKQVIVEQLLNIHDGESEIDKPADDNLPKRLSERQFFFKAEQLITDDAISALWENLGKFAAKDSWIEPTDSGGYKFRPEVREPMLDVLKESEILRKIHRSAALFFENEAACATTPSEVAHAEEEALYHMRLWDPSGDQERLLHRVKELFDVENFEAVLTITREYLGAAGEPPAFSRRIGELRVLAALAIADIALGAERESCVIAAEETIRAYGLLSTSRSGGRRRSGLLAAMLDARIRPRAEQAECLTTLRASDETDSPFRQWVDLSIAIALDKVGSRECTRIYTRLLNDRMSAGHPAGSPLSVFIARCLAVTVRTLGCDVAAVALLGKLKTNLIEIRTTSSPKLYASLLAALGSLLESYSRPDAARKLVDEFSKAPSHDTVALETLRACGVGRSFPTRGLKIYSRITEMIRDSDVPLRSHAMLGEAWTLAMMCDLNAAEETLHRALRQVSRHSPVLAARFHLILAEHHLRESRNFNAARVALQDYERTRGQHDPAQMDGLRARLLKLELKFCVDGETVEAAEARELLSIAPSSGFWYDRLRVAVSLIRLVNEKVLSKLSREFVSVVVTTFEALPDAIARTKFSELLADRREMLPFPESFRGQLAAYFTQSESASDVFGDPGDPTDGAWAALGVARWLLLLGENDSSSKLVTSATKHFMEIRSVTGVRHACFLSTLAGWGCSSPRSEGIERTFKGAPEIMRLVFAVEQGELILKQSGGPRDDDPSQREINLWSKLGNRAAAWYSEAKNSEELLVQQRSSWLARCHELGGAVGSGTDSLEREEYLLTKANTRYEELGDMQAQKRIRRRLELLVHADSGKVPREKEPAWTALPQLAPAIEINSSDPIFERIVESLRLEFGIGLGNTVHASGLVEAFIDWLDQPHVGMTPSTLEAVVNQFREKGAVASSQDLRWSLGGHFLAALPWELFVVDKDGEDPGSAAISYRAVGQGERHRIRWLQSTLNRSYSYGLKVDGVLGQKTQAAIDATVGGLSEMHHQPLRSEPIRAVVLGQTGSDQESQQRGLRYSGSRLEDLYRNVGIDCQVMEGVDLDGLASEWDYPSPPDIVHIYSSYYDSHSSGMTASPDWGMEKVSSRSARFHRWDRWPSLVILDGPGEPRLHEQVRQLLLRNTYAESLAARGEIPNIFAIGLEPYPDFNRYHRLLEGITRGKKVRSLYCGLTGSSKRMSPVTIDSNVLLHQTGTRAAALWTADPDLNAVP